MYINLIVLYAIGGSLREFSSRSFGLHRPCVVIYGEGLLLGTIVESLSMHEPELEIIGIQADDELELFSAIERYAPNAVIIQQCTQTIDPKRLTGLLADHPDMRVIMAGADDNWLQVYHRKDILLTNPEELIRMIRRV